MDISSIATEIVRRHADASECSLGNDYDGRMGARISSIFVIMAGGTFGAVFPIIASRQTLFNMPWWTFFAAKFFGSGVIITTALIHLLQPANEALSSECLSEAWGVYPYAYGICLFVLFLTFFLDIVSSRYLRGKGLSHDHGPSGFGDSTIGGAGPHQHPGPGRPHCHPHVHDGNHLHDRPSIAFTSQEPAPNASIDADPLAEDASNHSYTKEDHQIQQSDQSISNASLESTALQLGSLFFLEFGIIFHSVFIGLTLAVSGEEFVTLYIVLIFHQTFEGLGLGSRIAECWFPPHQRKWLPWVLGVAFGLTTPIAIAIGLGVRASYPPNSPRSLITNGVFDSISAGILLYVGTVELMGNEFLHSDDFSKASFSRVFFAFAVMCCGAGLMALLGRWA